MLCCGYCCVHYVHGFQHFCEGLGFVCVSLKESCLCLFKAPVVCFISLGIVSGRRTVESDKPGVGKYNGGTCKNRHADYHGKLLSPGLEYSDHGGVKCALDYQGDEKWGQEEHTFKIQLQSRLCSKKGYGLERKCGYIAAFSLI